MAHDPWRSFSPETGADAARVSLKLGNPAYYEDRDGYDPHFLTDVDLPMPGPGAWISDLVHLHEDLRSADRPPYELRYRHFSVVMSASRRLPLFSAVNIDGSLSARGVKRTDIWKFDPRIPREQQIIAEVYGRASEGFFSRGHMTRREDPNWGDPVTVKEADADTFHATNAAPQQQRFNAGVWLDLESYVLNNTDRENLRTTVITGPVFGDADPVYFGVRVPVGFWKILAYINPVTEEPTTLAYRRTQAAFMPAMQSARHRFVFGDFDDTQVTIASLQEDTGLDLQAFTRLDVLRDADPSVSIRLKSVQDAYLTR